MEIKARRPLLIEGVGIVAEGETFEADDQHARQLLDKGYAVEPGETEAEEKPQPRRRGNGKKE